MKRKCAAVFTALMLAHAAPGWALDAASAQAYCDEVKKAAQDAQVRHIQTAQPRQDPVKTFDDSVSSCLESIGSFKIGIPSIWDAVLDGILKQLMQRVCQAARAQFDQAVNGALQTVNQGVGTIPGTNMGTGVSVGQGSGAAGVSVQNDNGNTMKNAASRTVDRIVNIVK